MRHLLVANPPNPWLCASVDWLGDPPPAMPRLFADATREILSRNDSPDIPFTWSLNPFRGCSHACAYCYARPTHEYLGFGAGTDFETQIVAKLRAPELLRAVFERSSWKGEVIAFSGATDPWQPLEAALRLTRRCLEVCLEYLNPVAIVTKSALVERDTDVLASLAQAGAASASISIPFLDATRARALEPGAASPQRRLRTVERLAHAGVPVFVNVAPVIPGLNDEEIPRILAAAREAGAAGATWLMLRLPGSVKAVFEARLRAVLPERAERVLHRIRETCGGKLYDPHFSVRGRGQGHYADTIAALFETTFNKMEFPPSETEVRTTTPFRRPRAQLPLFR